MSDGENIRFSGGVLDGREYVVSPWTDFVRVPILHPEPSPVFGVPRPRTVTWADYRRRPGTSIFE